MSNLPASVQYFAASDTARFTCYFIHGLNQSLDKLEPTLKAMQAMQIEIYLLILAGHKDTDESVCRTMDVGHWTKQTEEFYEFAAKNSHGKFPCFLMCYSLGGALWMHALRKASEKLVMPMAAIAPAFLVRGLPGLFHVFKHLPRCLRQKNFNLQSYRYRKLVPAKVYWDVWRLVVRQEKHLLQLCSARPGWVLLHRDDELVHSLRMVKLFNQAGWQMRVLRQDEILSPASHIIFEPEGLGHATFISVMSDLERWVEQHAIRI